MIGKYKTEFLPLERLKLYLIFRVSIGQVHIMIGGGVAFSKSEADYDIIVFKDDY